VSHQVIARRYRPQGFDDVAGQAPLVRALRGALASGRLGAAYLFSGTRGVGKTTCARILAKCFNCNKLEKPGANPCGECPACVEIAEGRAMDVLEIDAASHTQVDKTREMLAGTQYAPARDRFKIIILDEVHMLSASSFNALLKTLEEPPAHLVFILATTEADSVPVTIRSRCLHFIFRPIALPELQSHLAKVIAAEGSSASPAAIERIARAAHGSLRDAQSLLEQLLALGGGAVNDADVEELTGGRREELAREYLAALPAGDVGALLDRIDAVVAASEEPAAFAAELLKAARDVLIGAVRGQPPEGMKATADYLAGDRGPLLLDLLMEQERRARLSGQPRAVLEAYAFRLARLKDLVSLDSLAAAPPAPAPPGRTAAPPPAPPGKHSAAPPPAPAEPEPIPSLPDAAPAAPSDPARFLEALGKFDSLAAGYVESARVERRGERVIIEFPATRGSSQKKMAKPESVALLLKAARQLWPQTDGVEVLLQGTASPAAPPAAPAALSAAPAPAPSAATPGATGGSRIAAPMKELRADPKVKQVMEFFGAELISVKPPKAAPAPESDDKDTDPVAN
jgi:DNA polymerase-3 subunit gamma/tau